MTANEISITVEKGFLKKLQTRGETIHLTYFRFRKKLESEGIDVYIGTYIKLDSLWNEDNHTLTASFGLNELWNPEENDRQAKLLIDVFYTTDKDILEGRAFTLGEVSEPAYVGNINLAGKRNDKIYVNIEFPEDTKANIECNPENDYITSLESEGAVPGINYWLYGRVSQIKRSDLVIRDIAIEYESSLASDKNSDPFSLNSLGERISIATEYKHYKKVEIRARDLNSRIVTDDTHFSESMLNYSTIYNRDIQIVGQCIFDKYKVINGTYILVDTDCTEDLSVATLRSLNRSLDLGETYLVDTRFNEKIVSFSSALEKVYYLDAFINFNAEIDEDGNALETPVPTEIDSNKIRFEVNSIWEVHYPSNLTQFSSTFQRDVIVMLFDSTEGSEGWNPGSYDIDRTSSIHIFTDSKLKIELTETGQFSWKTNDLVFEFVNDRTGQQDISNTFWRYFDYEIRSVYNSSTGQAMTDDLGRYKYELTFQTKQPNDTGSWLPNLPNEDLIVVSIKPNSLSSSIEPIRIICIQKSSVGLEIRKFQDISAGAIDNLEVTHEYLNQIGRPFDWDIVNSPSFTIATEGGSAEFPYYEISYDSSKLYITKPVGNIGRIYGDGQKVSRADNFKIFSAPGYLGSTATISISRKNKNGSVDLNNWRDLIYCYGKELTLNIRDWTSDYNGEYCGYNKLILDRFRFEPSGYTYEDWPLVIFDNRGGQARFDLKFPKLTHDEGAVDEGNLAYEIDADSISYEGNSDKKVAASKIDQETGGGIFITGEILDDYSATLYPDSGPITVTVNINVYKRENWGWQKQDTVETVKFYVIYKSSMVNYLSAYNDSGRIEKIVLTGENEKVPYDLYIDKSNEGNPGFNYWRFRKANSLIEFSDMENHMLDPEIHKIGEANSIGLILRNSKAALDNLELIYSYRQFYAGEIEYFRDWRNRLVYQDVSSIELTNKEVSREDIVVDYDTIYGDRETVDQYIDLDYIGIYKIYVKLDEEFRVSLEETNKLEHFYFYNTFLDHMEEDVLTVDIARTDVVNGIEVAFLFLGWEPNTFSPMSQQLQTTISIKSLTSSKSYTINLRRQYWNNTRLNSPRVNTEIIPNEDTRGVIPEDANNLSEDAKDIFRLGTFELIPRMEGSADINSPTSKVFKFSSKLEAAIQRRLFYNQIQEAKVNNRFDITKVSGKYIEGTVDANTRAVTCNPRFTNKNYLTQENRHLVDNEDLVISRGYLRHDASYLYLNFNDPGLYYYPLPPFQAIDIMNPLNFNGNRLSTYFYKMGHQLKPAYSKKIMILYNQLVASEGWYGFENDIIPGEMIYTYNFIPAEEGSEPIPLVVNQRLDVLVAGRKYRLEVSLGPGATEAGMSSAQKKAKICVTCLSGQYAGNGNISIGTIYIEYKLKNTSFLLDDTFNSIKLPQDYVDYWVKPKHISIDVTQLDQHHSVDQLQVDPATVGRFGAVAGNDRRVIIERTLSSIYRDEVGPYVVAPTDAVRPNNSRTIDRNDSVLILPYFKSMIHKTGYTGPITVQSDDEIKLRILDLGCRAPSRVNMVSLGSMPQSFSVEEGVFTQELWNGGLVIGDSKRTLFMGFHEDFRPTSGPSGVDIDGDVFNNVINIVHTTSGGDVEIDVRGFTKDGEDADSIIVLKSVDGEYVVVKAPANTRVESTFTFDSNIKSVDIGDGNTATYDSGHITINGNGSFCIGYFKSTGEWNNMYASVKIQVTERSIPTLGDLVLYVTGATYSSSWSHAVYIDNKLAWFDTVRDDSYCAGPYAIPATSDNMHTVILRYTGSDYEGWESEYSGPSTMDSCAEVYYHPEPKETDGEINASYFSGERGEQDPSRGWVDHSTCYNGFEASKGIIHVHIEH